MVKFGSKYMFIFRFTSTFSCPMTAEEYPFDEQTCIMDIASCKKKINSEIEDTHKITFRFNSNSDIDLLIVYIAKSINISLINHI